MGIPNKSGNHESASWILPPLLTLVTIGATALIVARGSLFGGTTPESPAPTFSPESVPAATASAGPTGAAAAQEQLRIKACAEIAQHHLPTPPQLHC